MADTDIKRCKLVDGVHPLTCEHQYGKGQLPFTLCKSDVPCSFRVQTEITTYDRYGMDVTNIKSAKEVAA